MNAQQLKNAILQEAIEGRLVPQDPNDEPASVLLDRIRKEKERLVKEGKLKKKDLEVKPISEDEIPFEIPDSWEWVRLKSLVSVLGDGIHGTPEYDITGDYYFINGNNLSNNKIVIKADTKKVNKKEYQTYKKELNDKTILVSINGTIGNVGHYNGEPIILGKSACYYNLLDISLKSYITKLMYTDYFLKYAVENATGSTIKNVSLAVMNDFMVPLPPVAEQQRIVAKIEELLPKVEEYGKAQDALNKLNAELPERLKKSVLQEAIEGRLVPQDTNDEPASVLLDKIRKEKEQLVKEGKLKKKDLIETPITEEEIPFEIPESWEWCRIPNIGISQLGKTKNPHQLSGLSLPYICSINVYWEGINLNQTKEMLFEESEIDKYTIKKGDLLICEGGDCGRSAIWDKENTILYQNALHRVRFFCNIESTYILYCLYLYKTSNQLEDYIKGETIKHLVKGELDSILFPLPPLAEQHRIVAKIEELFAEIDKLKA